MQKVVMKNLDEAISSVLTALDVSKRIDAAVTIREQLVPTTFESTLTDMAFGSGNKYHKFSNASFAGLKKSVSLDKGGCSIQSVHSPKPSLESNVINVVEGVSKSSDWSDDIVWREFLSRIIVHFWQYNRNRLTIEECRDEFLSSAKNCFGYGTHKYYPSEIKISIQSLQQEPTSHQNRIPNCPTSSKSFLSDVDDNSNSISPKPLIWASVESYLTCQINEEVSHDLKELNTIEKSLQLSICCEKIVVTEITMVQVKTMYGNKDVLSRMETSVEVQRIMLSDIVCWGYNDLSIAIKFKQRGNGHEASYYSDDEDEDTKNPKDEVSDVAYDLIQYSINTSQKNYAIGHSNEIFQGRWWEFHM